MKQNKKYSFERVDASDNVELHRSRTQRFHILAKLICLLLAVIFWLCVHAVQGSDETESDQPITARVQHEETVDPVSL